MIIVGLFGFIGSGKDAVADYLCKRYGFKKLTMSDIIKEELSNLNRPINREEMQKFSVESKAKHGHDIWAKKCIEHIKKNNWQKVVISGLRDAHEITTFKSANNFILVFVDANLDTRLNRLLRRTSEKDFKSREELIAQEKREIEIYDLYKSYQKYYDYKIDNNGSIDNLRKEIDRFVEKYKLNK